MFPLFETICIKEGQIPHTEWHEKRYAASYRIFFGRATHKRILEGIVLPDFCKNGIWKLKISYNEFEKISSFEPYEFRPINTLKLVEDNTIDYSRKYTDRNHLNTLFGKREQCDDILIVKNGFITDTSFCNIVFFDGSLWITPADPLLKGTARERLLHEGKILEKNITNRDMRNFESFKLINAMREFDEVDIIKIDRILY
jgi:4-amino-4-deoxychorismate lyase